MNGNNEYIEILTGADGRGMTWRVLAREVSGDQFMTMLECSTNSVTARAGFGGPKLYENQAVNSWVGQSDGLPPFVMVRTARQVTSVTAIGANGRRYPIKLSEVLPEFGLRFGAAPLADGETVVSLEHVVGEQHKDSRLLHGPHPGVSAPGQGTSGFIG